MLPLFVFKQEGIHHAVDSTTHRACGALAGKPFDLLVWLDEQGPESVGVMQCLLAPPARKEGENDKRALALGLAQPQYQHRDALLFASCLSERASSKAHRELRCLAAGSSSIVIIITFCHHLHGLHPTLLPLLCPIITAPPAPWQPCPLHRHQASSDYDLAPRRLHQAKESMWGESSRPLLWGTGC